MIEADRAVELGCGWGLAGIHLARVRGTTVTCTDIDPNLEPIVLKQAALNGVAVQFQAAGFEDLNEAALKVDLIFGCEVCYCEEACADLCRLTERAAKAGAGRLLIADPGRPDFEDLFAFCQKQYGATLTDIRLPDEGKPAHLMSVQF